MIAVRKESDEVLYPAEEVVLIDNTDLTEFKRMALINPRQRIRLCTHNSPSDALHEMFIVHTNETYVRPHKHIGKAESFSVLEGETDLVLFEDDGAVRQIIRMGPPGSGRKFYHRLASPVFHSLLIRSDILVFHEITQGPFLRGQTVFADWAPENMDAREWAASVEAFADPRLKHGVLL
jgi:cupin fold WbuC family metalloprotein